MLGRHESHAGTEDSTLVKQLCRFMTCKLQDGQMDGWKDGSMKGQNKIKKRRERRVEGQEDNQMMDGQTKRLRKTTAERTTGT